MTSPARLLREWNLYPKKPLGQNFLKDPSTAEMIVTRAGLLPEDIVLEIGAGLGALTIPVARMAKKVYTVEKDRMLIPLLEHEIRKSGLENITVLNQNILDVDIPQIADNESCKLTVMGNLPYNISSQVLIKTLNARSCITHCILMLQKELAQRIITSPGGKEYGRLSVMLQYCAKVQKIAEVKAAFFFPKPKVDSEIVGIKFAETQNFLPDNEMFFFKVIKAAFSKRRKMLKNTLAGSELEIDAETAKETLLGVGIDPSRRAETLSVEEFVKLSNALGRQIHPH
ncbi:16S rRNA (adenine(1518)-N(6)/adenine(1519)-N(6))-dimethyltransferase RsmA [Thermodesulfobacteriota bacterium]